MCRRPDVGLGNIRVPDSCRRYHRADTLALEPSCHAGGRGSPRFVAPRLSDVEDLKRSQPTAKSSRQRIGDNTARQDVYGLL